MIELGLKQINEHTDITALRTAQKRADNHRISHSSLSRRRKQGRKYQKKIAISSPHIEKPSQILPTSQNSLKKTKKR